MSSAMERPVLVDGADHGENARLGQVDRDVSLGAPGVDGDDAGFEDLRAFEVAGELVEVSAGGAACGGGGVHRLARLHQGGGEVARVEVGDHQGAAGGEARADRVDDAVRLRVVGQEVQDGDEQDGDRLGEVEVLGRGVE